MEQNIRYVGFWVRFLATILDSIMLVLVIMGLLLSIYGMTALSQPDTLGFGGFFINNILPIIAVLFFWYYKLATPGKIMMNVKIVDEATLGRPPFGRLVLRYFAYIVSILPLFLGFIWVAFDKKKQAFHDKIAKTVVIYEDSTSPDNSQDMDEEFTELN